MSLTTLNLKAQDPWSPQKIRHPPEHVDSFRRLKTFRDPLTWEKERQRHTKRAAFLWPFHSFPFLFHVCARRSNQIEASKNELIYQWLEYCLEKHYHQSRWSERGNLLCRNNEITMSLSLSRPVSPLKQYNKNRENETKTSTTVQAIGRRRCASSCSSSSYESWSMLMNRWSMN